MMSKRGSSDVNCQAAAACRSAKVMKTESTGVSCYMAPWRAGYVAGGVSVTARHQRRQQFLESADCRFIDVDRVRRLQHERSLSGTER